MKKLEGIVCANITPMNAKGEVDYGSLARLAQYLRDSGIQGIYPNGTNGESLSLSAWERRNVAETIVRESAGQISVYVQCGSSHWDETLALIKHSKQIGADGAGVMTPSFFRCDDDALEQYYDSLMVRAGDFPIYLYNIPSLTGNDIKPLIFSRLREKHANIQGIKYSAPDLLRIRQYLEICSNVLIGCDSMILDCLMAGGAGTISGPCAVFPERFARLYRQYLEGDFKGASQTQTMIYKTSSILGDMPEIPAIKTILKWRGVIDNEVCRAPLRRLSKDECTRLEKLYETYAAEENIN